MLTPPLSVPFPCSNWSPRLQKTPHIIITQPFQVCRELMGKWTTEQKPQKIDIDPNVKVKCVKLFINCLDNCRHWSGTLELPSSLVFRTTLINFQTGNSLLFRARQSWIQILFFFLILTSTIVRVVTFSSSCNFLICKLETIMFL